MSVTEKAVWVSESVWEVLEDLVLVIASEVGTEADWTWEWASELSGKVRVTVEFALEPPAPAEHPPDTDEPGSAAPTSSPTPA